MEVTQLTGYVAFRSQKWSPAVVRVLVLSLVLLAWLLSTAVATANGVGEIGWVMIAGCAVSALALLVSLWQTRVEDL